MTEIGAIYKKYRAFFTEGFSSTDAFLLKNEDIDNQLKVSSFFHCSSNGS